MSASLAIPSLEILPQRPPVLLVDQLVHYDPACVRTVYTVPQEGLLIQDGCLSEAGVLEHIAQSSAARIGYISKYILHIPIRIGYIGSIRNGLIYRLPRCGERLETVITLRQEMMDVTMVDAEVYSAGELLAQANLKTALGGEIPE